MEDKFIVTYQDLSYMKEDMFQAEYKNLILDAWYYWDWLVKIKIIKDINWENPLEQISFTDSKLILPFIDILRWRLIDWYYDGDYMANKWLDKEI